MRVESVEMKIWNSELVQHIPLGAFRVLRINAKGDASLVQDCYGKDGNLEVARTEAIFLADSYNCHRRLPDEPAYRVYDPSGVCIRDEDDIKVPEEVG